MHFLLFCIIFPLDPWPPLAPLTGEQQGLGQLEILGLDDSTLDFSNYRGKIVLVDLWATWCGPCRASFPGLERMVQNLKDRPFVLVSISLDRDIEEVRKSVILHRHFWPQFFDPKGISMNVFKADSIPHFVVLDEEGRELASRRGWARHRDRELRAIVEKAIVKLEKKQAAAAVMP